MSEQVDRVVNRLMPRVDAVLISRRGIVRLLDIPFSMRKIEVPDYPDGMARPWKATYRWDGLELDYRGRRVFRRV